MKNWLFNEEDKMVFQNLEGFVPDRVFDIHAHIYRLDDLNLKNNSILDEGPSESSIDIWKSHIQKQVGNSRIMGGLFFSYPSADGNIKDQNNYIIDELKMHPESRGLMVVSPGMDRDMAEEYLKNRQIAGFKVYHVYSGEKPTSLSAIGSFAPEWIWRTANSYGAIIMLHLVKQKAAADAENQLFIRDMCGKYPNVKLVLAHAGRGFHWYNTKNGLQALRGLQNLWFDTSSICEPGAIKAVLYEFGPRKLLWGSDYPISQIRGKAVTAGDGFVWLQDNSTKWDNDGCKPVLVGMEALRALRDAAEDFGLNEEDMQDIFCDNAIRLLVLEKEPGNLTQELYRHAKGIIPGGTQLLSKRPEMMAPDIWPSYYREARGCEVWDIDGRHYYDISTNGIGACLLGFRDPDVTKAVMRRINLGSMCTLNPPEEVELAEALCGIHPWAEQVRFTRTGGEAGAVAVRIARATTDRSIIAICGYHGWHDWYLAANLGESDALRGHLLPGLSPLGVPTELRGTSVTFRYNNRNEFQDIIDKYGHKLAAVIMEPCRDSDPEEGFLEYVREQAHKCGALLIFDEITIGWRLCYGGSHLKFGVTPDIAIFAKALGNGYPIGAVMGTREAMFGANTSFISSTYWTEGIGPAAALAALKKMQRLNVHKYVAEAGNKVIKIWQDYSAKHSVFIETGTGYPCLAHFKFIHGKAEELRTLFTQFMLEKGFLSGTGFYPTMAHTEEILSLYAHAADETFGQIADVIQKDKIDESLKGPVAHNGFKRLL